MPFEVPPPPTQMAPPTTYNPFAIASLLIGFVPCGLISIAGVVFGHVALGTIKKTNQPGKGMAIAGLALGYFWIVVTAIFLILVLIANVSGTDFS